MGCANSRREQQPRVVGWRYEEFAQALKNDPYRGPTSEEKRRISEYQPREFEPTDDSKPPLLFLAKDSEEWFGCLIEKCDPTVMWIDEGGKRKGLDYWLMGKRARNFTVWSTKIDEWKRKHPPASIVTTRTGPPPTRAQDFWTPELSKLALALGIGAAAGFAGIPAAAVGSGIWMVMQKWHTSFSTEIGATGFGAQELEELQQHFERCAVRLGRLITLLGTRIEEIDANNLDAQAEERRGNLQARVDTLRCFLEHDIAEMDRITRRRSTSQREKKLSMMTKLRSLWDLCTTEEALCTTQETREIMRRMPSQQQLLDGNNAMPPTRCFPQRSLSTFSTPGQRSAFGTASSFDGESARAGDPPVPFDAWR